jgi:hypothetical protein
MFLRLTRLLGLLLALAPVVTRGADPWSRLKLGMTAEETTAVLGVPLVRTSGRGFEIWSYDNGAEALLYGSLIGWTASGSSSVADRSVDIWRAKRTESYFPTFLALLPRRVVPSKAPVRSASPANVRQDDVWIPLYVRRGR